MSNFGKGVTMKACPFCGNRTAEAKQSDGEVFDNWFVQCGCGMRTRLYARKAGAVRRWNTRPDSRAA